MTPGCQARPSRPCVSAARSGASFPERCATIDVASGTLAFAGLVDEAWYAVQQPPGTILRVMQKVATT